MAVNRYQLEDMAPYIYRTTDYGRTWRKIVNGIPATEFVRVVREDPVRRGLLFAGTERGGRSEERRVGEEGRARWAPDYLKKKKGKLRAGRRGSRSPTPRPPPPRRGRAGRKAPSHLPGRPDA